MIFHHHKETPKAQEARPKGISDADLGMTKALEYAQYAAMGIPVLGLAGIVFNRPLEIEDLDLKKDD
jgi:hypothetical protein